MTDNQSLFFQPPEETTDGDNFFGGGNADMNQMFGSGPISQTFEEQDVDDFFGGGGAEASSTNNNQSFNSDLDFFPSKFGDEESASSSSGGGVVSKSGGDSTFRGFGVDSSSSSSSSQWGGDGISSGKVISIWTGRKEGELPLLEELGINFSHIFRRTLLVRSG